MEVMESKRVSMIELFYNLVFAYMLAQATDMIHHLHDGVVPLQTMLAFIL